MRRNVLLVSAAFVMAADLAMAQIDPIGASESRGRCAAMRDAVKRAGCLDALTSAVIRAWAADRQEAVRLADKQRAATVEQEGCARRRWRRQVS